MKMRKLLLLFILFSITQLTKADYGDDVVAVIPPSGTLPVLYINTVDQAPVDQKEVYIEATAWLDSSMTDEFESLGSESEPVTLGIRGRGNATWFQSVKKPYKLRFDEKQSVFGSEKNRHYALLHLQGPVTSFFHEPLAFRAAELLGDEWVPMCKPCEVVLNGEYLGLYFLTETVRAGKHRVNITEQLDEETDPEKIDSGWLVEIDNNPDDNQIELLEPNGRSLLLTFKSPEILSEPQLEYIESEFYEIIRRVHNIDGDAEDWLDIIDGESIARHYIINEIMRNMDGFCGSFYWHKDKGTKWTAGPAWDYGYALIEREEGAGSYLRFFGRYGRPNLIREMLNSEDFHRIIREVWEEFYSLGTDWIDEVKNDWIERTAAAGEQNFLVWGIGEAMYWRGDLAATRLKENIEWMNDYLQSDAFNNWVFVKMDEVKTDLGEGFGSACDLLGRPILNPESYKGIIISGQRKIYRGNVQ